MTPKVYLIVAVSENLGIGNRGQLPWRLKQELKHFSNLTRCTTDLSKCNAVIMGRRTWESIPLANRPLPQRHNLILSSQMLKVPLGATVYSTLDSALKSLDDNVETAWIIGGSSVYEEALEKGICDRLYVTRILRRYDCDVFFPDIGPEYTLTKDPDVSEEVQIENDIQYKFEVYEKVKN